jgi:uncharacterized membrane protein
MAAGLSTFRAVRALLPRSVVCLLLMLISVGGWVNPSGLGYVLGCDCTYLLQFDSVKMLGCVPMLTAREVFIVLVFSQLSLFY